MSYLDEVAQQVRDWDAARARSQQKDIGWSGMHGCRAYMGFRLDGAWATHNPDEWAAIKGTGLHGWLTEVRRAATGDSTSYGWEVPVEYGGVRGHADEVFYAGGAVTDWKFPKLSSARLWDDPEILDERFTQPQGYAAGVMATDRWKVAAPKQRVAAPLVRVLVCPVDGTFEDWRLFERPFDRDVADAALERYAYVKQARARGEELPKDKPLFFCKSWCQFYGLCRGKDEEDKADSLPDILDPELAAAVEAYGLAAEAKGEAGRAMELYASIIRGLRGTARGWNVSLTRPGQPGEAPDLEAIAADYQFWGERVPMKPTAPAKPKLNVRRAAK